MTLEADLFFSFRSPYSYLAIGRYRAMTEEFDLDITLRTVLPIAIRDPDILFTGNPAAPRYIVMDCMRAGQFLGFPISWPRPDPVVQNLATREIAAEQPYIHRLCRLGQAATRRGRSVDGAMPGTSVRAMQLRCAAVPSTQNVISTSRGISNTS